MRYFHRNELLAYGLLAVAALVASLPLYPYQWHLLLHIMRGIPTSTDATAESQQHDRQARLDASY